MNASPGTARWRLADERHEPLEDDVLEDKSQQSHAKAHAQHDEEPSVVTHLQLRVLLRDALLEAVSVGEMDVVQVVYIARLVVLLDLLAKGSLATTVQLF